MGSGRKQYKMLYVKANGEYQEIGRFPPRVVRIKEVLARFGYITPYTLMTWESEGLFPKRRKIGSKFAFYLEHEIDAVIAGTWKPDGD